MTIIVGIDPGAMTGIAAWNVEQLALTLVDSMSIHKAMKFVEAEVPALVLFEDARKRRWFGKMDAEQRKYGAAVREGAGSVKRDCSIWDDFLTDLQRPFVARHPTAGGTKWDAEKFRLLTKWPVRTNEHARDAALLVYGMNARMMESLISAAQARRR